MTIQENNMMNDQHPKNRPFPWLLLGLDLFGSLLVAWGVFQYVGNEGGVMYIIVGFLLMLPFTLHIISRAQGHGRKSRSAEDR